MKGVILALSFVSSVGAFLTGARAETLPVPPIPPDQVLMQAAPLPNRDARGPYDPQGRLAVTLDPTLNRRDSPDSSRGFPPGSRYRNDDDRGRLTIPGISVRLPFP